MRPAIWAWRFAPWALTLTLCLPTLLPLLGPGFPRTDDGLGHLFRIVELDRALRAGVLYPRWASELAMGYGYPVLNFYAPLSYYAVEALHRLGLGFLAAYKTSLGASLLLAGLAAYLLARDVLRDRLAAALAAVAYVVAPYPLADAYLRGALGESWTFVFIPLSLWAFGRLVCPHRSLAPCPQGAGPGRSSAAETGTRPYATARRGAYLALSALALAALILSHNAIALMTLPLLVAYIAFLLWRAHQATGATLPALRITYHASRFTFYVSRFTFYVSRITPLILAFALALALSAFYWLPALAEKSYTRVDDLLTGFHGGVAGQLVEPWRLVQLAPAYDYAFDPTANPFRLGLVQALAAGAGLAAVALRWGLERRRAGIESPRVREGGRPAASPPGAISIAVSLLFFALTTGAVLFMLTTLSLALWTTVPLISFVEFPWRLLTLAGLGTALLTGGLIAALPERPIWRGAVLAAAVVALTAAALWNLHPPTSTITEAEVTAAAAARFDYNVGAIGTNKASEYLPPTVQENPTQIPRGDLLARGIASGPAPDLALLRADPMAVDLLTAEDSPGGPVVLHQFYFPGWTAWVDDQSASVEPVGSLGLVRVDAPPGAHRISFRFTDTPVRALANLVALAGLLALLALLAGTRSWRALAATGALVLVLGLLFSLLPGNTPPSLAGAKRGAGGLDGVDFGPALRLLGYHLDTSRLNSARELDVTLYWQARQPLATSHIIDVGLATEPKADHGVLAVHRGIPVYGCSPTTKWEVGEIVADRRTLRLTSDAPPGRYVLAAAVRQSPQGPYIELAPGEVVAWLTEVDATGIAPARIQTPQHAAYVPLQGILELVGLDTAPAFTGDTLVARPGQTIVVTPHWRAADAWVPYDYTMRLTLRDRTGAVAAQADYEPIYDVPATSPWGLDWRDARALPFPLPHNLPPGDYTLECELYHGYDEQRLWPLRADRAAFDLFNLRVADSR